MYFFSTVIFVTLVCLKGVKLETNCTCVPYYQCSDEYTNLIRDGGNILEIREQVMDTKCIGYFDVCCPFNNTEIDVTEEPKQEVFKGCGYQPSRKFPWSLMIYTQKRKTSPYQYKCGGSLIHAKVVVTAAHCVDNNKRALSVRLGPMKRSPKIVILHPNYNSNNLQNDIALLVLQEPFELNENVNTICIPPPGLVLDNDKCTVGLWKNTLFSSTTPYLKLLKLPLVPKVTCVKSLKSTRLGIFFQLHKSFLCAGGEFNKDTCVGDGGSPLVCPISNQPGRHHQVGIVSWGIGCGDDNIPGVYVNLGLFRNWIDEQMIFNGLDVISYRY